MVKVQSETLSAPFDALLTNGRIQCDSALHRRRK